MFTDARLKFQRANEHVTEVKRRISLIVSPDSQTRWVEVHPHSGVQTIHYRLDRIGDLPDLALVIGDAIHNFNTVLDYAWLKTITALNPSAVSKFAKFPVYGSLKDLEDALRGWDFDTLTPRLFNLIVADIKPYKGGDYSIWAIHTLDIRDKHRLLIPTTNYGSIHGLKIKDELGAIHPLNSRGTELEGESVIAIPSGLTIEDKGRASFSIIFKEGPTKGMEIGDIFYICADTVLRVTELLEKIVEG